MTTKLNQLIAIESGLKTTSKKGVTVLYRDLDRSQLFTGISRVYTPKDEDGDRLPSESTLVQKTAEATLFELGHTLARLFDVTLTKETANAKAKADVVVDGKVLLESVPVTYLLFLEKQLVDINTFVAALPTLDPAQSWLRDENIGAFVTAPTQTVRTKKVPRNHVLAEATDKHPAQVNLWHEDVIVGTWTKIDVSGAVSSTRKAELLERVSKLTAAVKFAREAANSIEVIDVSSSNKVFGYLFA